MTTSPRIRIGALADAGILNGPVPQRQALVQRALHAGVSHFFVADHISFHTGFGIDGLIQAALVTSLHPDAHMCVGVYLLALRHPLPVARQLATIAESAPGRLILGVGVGGEDPHEFEICGVDPRTRGRRTDEMLGILGPLLTGEPVTHSGEFFTFEDARIRPAPKPAIPIVIGGRADAALRRTAQFGDGWIGIWSSPRRYAEVIQDVEGRAAGFGRTDVNWQHGIQVWAAVDTDRAAARARLAKRMQSMYRVPYEKFEKYSPYGSPREVADALLPYAEAGCRFFNIMMVANSSERAIDDVAAIAEAMGAA